MAKFDPRKHHRRSIRLRDYDYSRPGAYYVTICSHRRECLFGEVVGSEMRYNEFGRGVCECWEGLPKRYPNVDLDEWIVMPNHMHGIIVIVDDRCRGGSRTAPTKNVIKRKPLGRLIGAFKTVSTKHINEMRGTPGAMAWQRGYYEHIIRDGADLNRIRRYIRNNPARWAEDENNPDNWMWGRFATVPANHDMEV